ncbi:metalloprotease [Vineibacter terrae]|uniref:metalloprotease n=1 Tax=Vineibacter terrae TaxID=2586908 RepID=UPI002E37D0B5|nr:metalloprotease [Vineibacter terrae]HEX2885618.1 metalloprotease [Vineibacter terrae]
MIARREVILGGSLTLLWAAMHPCAGTAQARSRAAYRGCILTEAELSSYYDTKAEMRMYMTGREPIIHKSGNAAFDYALAQTLARLTATLQVLPGFAYYDDHDGLNAFASDAVRMQKADGTVLFGSRLLRRLMAGDDHPDVAVTAVCAHEYGHILQFKRGLIPRLQAGQTTVKRAELHADFLAGYYAGRRKLEKRDYPAAVFAATQHSFGDNQVSHPSHHGTPDERAAAIVAGFKAGYEQGRPLEDAITTGIAYVSRL